MVRSTVKETLWEHWPLLWCLMEEKAFRAWHWDGGGDTFPFPCCTAGRPCPPGKLPLLLPFPLLTAYRSHQCPCSSNETNTFLLQRLSICSFLCLECSPSRSSHGWLLSIVQVSTQTSSLTGALSESIPKLDPTPTNLYHNILFCPTYGTYLVYLFIFLSLCSPLECKLHELW